jgi:hypothetical protein
MTKALVKRLLVLPAAIARVATTLLPLEKRREVNEVPQRLLARHGIDHVSNPVVRMRERRHRDPEQEVILPHDPFQVVQQGVLDIPLGPDPDLMNDLDEQLNPVVSDLLGAAGDQRRDERVPDPRGVRPQLSGPFRRGPLAVTEDPPRGDPAEEIGRQPHAAQPAQPGELGEHALQPDPAGIRLQGLNPTMLRRAAR